MRETDRKYLSGLAQGLDESDRLGADTDVPEGMRWIQISDTLAKMMAERLRGIAEGMSDEDLREEVGVYLAQQLGHLHRVEALYLVRGVSWAVRRIRGEEPSEADLEPAPSESLDEFLARGKE